VIGELHRNAPRKALLLSGGSRNWSRLAARSHRYKNAAARQTVRRIAPALSERLSEVLASLKGKDLTLLMSQST